MRVTDGTRARVTIEGDTLADRADGKAGLGEAVEAAEDGEAEAVVDYVALADQLAVLVDLLDIPLHRAGEKSVREPLAGDAERSVPRGGEDGVAAASGVSAGDAHTRGLAGFGDDGSLSKGFAEDRHLFAGPAIMAGAGGHHRLKVKLVRTR